MNLEDMNIGEFIDNNHSEIYDMALHAAEKVLPWKKKHGFSVDNDTYDEADFIIKDVKTAIAFALNSENNESYCESGFYKVTVEICSNGDISIDIDFTLEKKYFKIGDSVDE